jgi:hypothetical protein
LANGKGDATLKAFIEYLNEPRIRMARKPWKYVPAAKPAENP